MEAEGTRPRLGGWRAGGGGDPAAVEWEDGGGGDPAAAGGWSHPAARVRDC